LRWLLERGKKTRKAVIYFLSVDGILQDSRDKIGRRLNAKNY
jgi:hypothetical protein